MDIKHESEGQVQFRVQRSDVTDQWTMVALGRSVFRVSITHSGPVRIQCNMGPEDDEIDSSALDDLQCMTAFKSSN